MHAKTSKYLKSRMSDPIGLYHCPGWPLLTNETLHTFHTLLAATCLISRQIRAPEKAAQTTNPVQCTEEMASFPDLRGMCTVWHASCISQDKGVQSETATHCHRPPLLHGSFRNRTEASPCFSSEAACQPQCTPPFPQSNVRTRCAETFHISAAKRHSQASSISIFFP